MHRRMNPREQRRMMQRMGMNMDAMPDVEQVIIKTGNKEITIEQPEVTILEVQRSASSASKIFVSEEDVKLVADQTGKSIGEAKKALEECDGDLAKAILLLQS